MGERVDNAVSARQRTRWRVDRISGGERASAEDTVVVEAALAIRARGRTVATVMRTPGDDVDLVRGFLHAEGILAGGVAQSAAEPDAIDVDAPYEAFAPRAQTASAACGVCGREVIADLEAKAVAVASTLTVTAAWVSTLPERARQQQEVFAETGGLHAAALFAEDGKLWVLCEDVGRHNAVDKVVGWALRHHIDAARTVLMLSGRIGFELVQKAIMLGVPIIAAVGAPTTLALELADRFRIATCGFVRADRMNVYTHTWRVR